MLKISEIYSCELGVLGGEVESWIRFASYLMGQKLRCLILNPLQQLQEIGIVYPIYNEGGRGLSLQGWQGDVTSVRLLCLLMGEQELKPRSVWLQSPALQLIRFEGPLSTTCCAECSLFSELLKILDLGHGELQGWRLTKHRDHWAGGCLRLTVCGSVL